MHNEFATVEETRGKYIFWDIDGTLAPYRYNNHVGDPEGTQNGQSLQEIEDGVFLKRQPSRHMQAVIASCEAEQNIILGHCLNSKEKADKLNWVPEHYPSIETVLLISEQQSKADKIIEYCQENGIELSRVLFVDDTLPILREAERKGIKSYHISSFLDWLYFYVVEV